jgi:hypothetical protein
MDALIVLIMFAAFIALVAALGAVASAYGADTRPAFTPYAAGN